MSGNSKRRGRLSKTGNTRVRAILVDAAWNYRLPARIGGSLHPASKASLNPLSTLRARRSFDSVTDSAGCGHAAFIRTRRVRPSPGNYSASFGTSERDCSQPNHARGFIGSRRRYSRTDIFHPIGNAAPGTIRESFSASLRIRRWNSRLICVKRGVECGRPEAVGWRLVSGDVARYARYATQGAEHERFVRGAVIAL